MNEENKKIIHYLKTLKLNHIKLLACSQSGKKSVWVEKQHSHPYFEFIYFMNAKAQIDVPFGKLDLVPYDVVIYPPGVTHHEHPDLTYPQEIICIAAYIDTFDTLSNAFQFSDKDGTIGWLFEQSYQEYFKKEEGYESMIAAYIKAIILHAIRSLQSNKLETSDILNTCVRFIHEHFHESLSMTQLTEISCVSESYISRLFQKNLGMSPMRYLNSVRIDISKKLLLDFSLSINEIAIKVGINDPLYFSRVFRKFTGNSPTEFRNLLK